MLHQDRRRLQPPLRVLRHSVDPWPVSLPPAGRHREGKPNTCWSAALPRSNLISQDTTSYGRDLEAGTDLPSLLRALGRIGGRFWIRLLYGHPVRVTDRLLETMGEVTQVCRYLDLRSSTSIRTFCGPCGGRRRSKWRRKCPSASAGSCRASPFEQLVSSAIREKPRRNFTGCWTT